MATSGDIYLTTAQVCTRYGGIVDLTLRRWRADIELKFPSPTEIRGRLYWKASDLDKWDADRAKVKAVA